MWECLCRAQVFKALTLARGDLISFTWTTQGLEVARGEPPEVLACIPSHTLASALFATYLDADSAVSKPCAVDIGAAFEHVPRAKS